MEEILNQVESIDEAVERLKQKLEQDSKLRETLDDFVIVTAKQTVDNAINDIKSDLAIKLENYADKDALKKLGNEIDTKLDNRLKPLATADSVSVVKEELDGLTEKLDKLVTKEYHQSLIKKLEVGITSSQAKVDKTIESVKSELIRQMEALAGKQDLNKMHHLIVQEYEKKIEPFVSLETLNKKAEEQANTWENSLAKLATKESQEKLSEKMQTEWKNKLAEYAKKNDITDLNQQINETVSKYASIKKTSIILAAVMLCQWIVILLMLAGVIN